MEYNEFYSICKQIFAKNSFLPALDEQKVKKLYALTVRMLEVNRTMNLTAIKDERSVILKHYADSLVACDLFKEGSTVIDVGCGAGFPTLPLAIFRPDLKITALDSTTKRIEYVKESAKLLELDNIIAIADRAEIIASKQEFREQFDYATARAVAGLPILAELCLPLVKIGGKFVAMKAQKADEELVQASNAIVKCGGVAEPSSQIKLADADGNFESRTVICISKKSKTPKEYPRHYSKISKKPL